MRPEIQKEMAYGKSSAEIKAAMPGVTDEMIRAIPKDVISERRASLTEKGYIR